MTWSNSKKFASFQLQVVEIVVVAAAAAAAVTVVVVGCSECCICMMYRYV